MTAGRITTRAGRRIRYVAPGHVVDVATGVHLQRPRNMMTWQVAHPTTSVAWRERHRLSSDAMVDGLLGHVARAEAVCALVRVMLAVARMEYP